MINLLHIEDDPADYLLVVRHLRSQGIEANVVLAETLEDLTAAVEQGSWDAVLADYNVPGLAFRNTLSLLTRRLPDCPVILISGSIGEENAAELFKDGIWDFVLKDNLARLCPALERSLRDSAQRRARQEAERSLHESEERFQLIAATLAETIWLADAAQGQITYVSPAYETVWQQTCASLYEEPASFLNNVHQDDRHRITQDLQSAYATGQPFTHEFRVVRPDGSTRWVVNRGFPVITPSGRPTRYVGVVVDVTERHQAEEQLRQAATVFESTREGVMIVDLDGYILAINKAFTDISGYSEAESLGQKPNLQNSGRHGPEFFQAMWTTLINTGQWQGEIWNRRKIGEVYPAWLSISTVRDKDSHPTHYVGVFSDISQIKRSEEQLAHLAHYDPLTELPNRLLLQSQLEHALGRAERNGQRAAVLFVDLDYFKTVNDSLGHVIGDQLLIDVAGRLRARIRDEDVLGRFGGDEFLLLLEPIGSPEEAAIVARDILTVLAEPFQLGNNNEAFIGASIGISIFPEDGTSAANLLRDADTAMNQAKQQGRNCFCFYTADMNKKAMAQLELEASLRRAMERNEFVLYYQPKVDLHTGLITGAEALIRWPRDGGRLESPAHFIPLAEKTGLIVPIGNWVIGEACRQLKTWQDTGLRGLQLSVNVSGRQFHSGDLPALVTQSLERHRIAPGMLELEVTESMLMENPEQTVSMLNALKHSGVKLSLDDFGTGYSSFAYLSRFPIDTLKIDQSFVHDIATKEEAAMICVSIIDLAHRMRLKVVAEGVETEAQMSYLMSRSCDAIQGYYVAKPMPAAVFTAFVQNWKNVAPQLMGEENQ
ncbi:MAG: response regulator receiver modulated diguanylate cyclase/phosphodiesterase with sensor(s) [Proteobacteria bacterium]|nr:response regulator receiver modulated diguanylate cyclase/phosphodiesterase with sensor(s) [Pseudomonadota bacterium]